MKNYTRFVLPAIIIFACGCKTPYQPQIASTPNSYLVVDGVINNSNGSTDSTFFKLSHTSGLSASDALNPVLHAQVSVEDGQGFSIALKETGKGNYAAGPLGLNNTKPYRLRIKTADNKIYLSDLAASIYTPPIDTIGYTFYNGQIIIYANTHNPANTTRNYRWDFTETWEFRASYQSYYMSDGTKIVSRDPAHEYPMRCWNSDASTGIILASSAKLVNDVIYQQPITYIGNSPKLSARYSILLKQYGLSDDAFKFWQQIQKNTEQLGSIFDAQPSQINGNIHNTTNAAEPVFGYISITNIQTKRVYINRSDLPVNYITSAPTCASDSIFFVNPQSMGNPPDVAVDLIPIPGADLIPLVPIYKNPIIPPVGYVSAAPGCVDCSLSGSKVAPPFWKEQ